MVSDGGGLAHAGGSEYTVVLRARSSAYFLPEEGWEHHFSLPGLALGMARTRAGFGWVGLSTSLNPSHCGMPLGAGGDRTKSGSGHERPMAMRPSHLRLPAITAG